MSARPRIAVVGKGVIGLTSALRLLEAGYPVALYHRSDGHTASLYAGAYWWPHKIDPPRQVGPWAAASLEVYTALARDPATGIHWTDHLRLGRVPDPAAYALDALAQAIRAFPTSRPQGPAEAAGVCLSEASSRRPQRQDPGAPQSREFRKAGYQQVDEQQVRALGFQVEFQQGYRLCVPRIEVHPFLAWLEGRVRAAGGKFVARRLEDLHALFPQHDLVVHCAGLGVRELVGDETMIPIGGHTVRVETPAELRHSLRVVDRGEVFTLILPHGRDCVLGGTDLPHDENLEPDPEIADQILERCRQAQPLLRGARVLETTVGLRPGRPEIRLELEEIHPGRPVVHNYGHGGGGYTVAWGCAAEVVARVEEALP